jgi:hypothetical protein
MKANETDANPTTPESWLRVAFVGCLLVGVLGGPALLFLFGCDRLWVVTMLWGVIGVSSVLVSRRIAWRIDSIQALKMRSAARSDNRPPILILRSFSLTGLAFRPGRYEDSYIAPGESYLNVIATVLGDIGCLLAIGGPDDTIEMSEKSLLYFQSAESGWAEMFRLASEAARAVIVIPGITQGILQEIRELISSGAVSKVIVFMPPTPSEFVGKWIARYSGTEAIATSWTIAQSEWGKIGVSLPDYDKSGMLFALDPSGRPRREVKLNGRVEGLDLTPIRELTKQSGGSSAPVSVLIPKLERLEAARKRAGLLREFIRLVVLGY